MVHYMGKMVFGPRSIIGQMQQDKPIMPQYWIVLEAMRILGM